MKSNASGYIKLAPYIFIGQSKCCRPTFALAEGERVDFKFQGKLDKELFLGGVHFIALLVKKRIKIYISYEDKESRTPLFVIAYLKSKGISVEKLVSLIKKRFSDFNLDKESLNLLKDFKN